MKKQKKQISTRLRKGLSPPFYEMSFEDFEDLSRDLFEQEPEIESCHTYGVKGQTQDGIDLLAYLNKNGGIEVGQCKCYKDFPPRKIRNVTTKFFESWDIWKDKGVRRFILFVASDLNTRQRVKEIAKQKKIFKKKGIRYEVWQASKIRNKLRPHKGIVRTHMGESWVHDICDDVETLEHLSESRKWRKGKDIINFALIDKVERFEDFLSEEMDNRLGEFRELWKAGNRKAAFEWIEKIRSEKSKWNSLKKETKAKLIRFQASLILSRENDIESAKKLADEADTLVGKEKQNRLRAIIAHREKGPNDAINLLKSDDIESINLRLACLIELEKNELIFQLLNDIQEENYTAETYRLTALFYLSQQNLERAELEINKGLQIKPNWKDLKFVNGMVQYFKAYPISLLPSYLVPWPEPIDKDFIKVDNQSIDSLSKAENIFSDLIENELDENEKSNLKIWKLASLILNNKTLNAASEYLQALIENNPIYYQAIIWGVVSRLEFNKGKTISALKKALNEKKNLNSSIIIALVACYLDTRKFNRALKVLEEKKENFHDSNNGKLQWNYWYCQTHILNGKPDKALSQIKEVGIENELEQIKKMALHAKAINSKNWQELCKLLIDTYESNEDIRSLLEYCSIKFENSDWNAILKYSSQLVDSKISLAIRYVYLSYFKSYNYKDCLEVINESSTYLENSHYTDEKNKIRALCKFKLGLYPEAIHEAELIVKKDPSTSNLLTLTDLYVSKGDLHAIVPISRKLLNRDDVKVRDLLVLTSRVEIEDKDLATAIWRKAVKKGIPNHYFSSAIDLGFKIGLDEEASKLLKTVDPTDPEKYGLHTINFDEAKELLIKDREKRIEIIESYDNAEIPIHILTRHNNLTIAEIFFNSLNQQESNPENQSKVFIRYGGRELKEVQGFLDEAEKFSIDVTSLLITDYLNILDKVIEDFDTIYISNQIIPSLVEMREKLQSHQPSRDISFNNISQLIDLNEIKVTTPPEIGNCGESLVTEAMGINWASKFKYQKNNSGYVFEYFPLTDKNLNKIDDVILNTIEEYVIGQHSLILSLFKAGAINKNEKEKYLNKLDKNSKYEEARFIKGGSSIYANIEHLISLNSLGILNAVSNTFDIIISNSDYKRLNASLNNEKQERSDIDSWLKNLITKINQGLEDNKFIIIPESKPRDKIKNGHFSQTTEALLNLIDQTDKTKGIICCDDRFTNKNFIINNKIIISTVDLIYHLWIKDSLLDDDYFSLIHQLRLANFRFISFEKEELIYQLKQASISGQQIIETKQLKTIRRYHASTYYDEESIDIPKPIEGEIKSLGEFKYFKSLYNVIDDTLFVLWSDNELSEEDKIVYSNWIIDNLHYDQIRKSFLSTEKQDSVDLLYIAATRLSGYIVRAQALITDEDDLKAYFNWLYVSFLKGKLKNNPQLTEIISDKIKASFNSFLNEDDKSKAQKKGFSPDQIEIGTKLLFIKFYKHLPALIKEEIRKDTFFMERFGYDSRMVLTLSGLEFKANEYWNSAYKAVNGISSKIQPLNYEKEIVFETLGGGNEVGFKFKDPRNDQILEIKNDFQVWVLLPSQKERLEKLNQMRSLFDFPRKDFEVKVKKISTIEDLSERVNKIFDLYHSSPTVFYKELEEKVRGRLITELSELIPDDLSNLKRYYRLNDDDFNIKNLNSSLLEMIEEDGVEKALNRYLCLPVKLPDEVIDLIRNQNEQEIRNLVKSLLNKPNSPVALVHLIYILNAVDNNENKYTRLSYRLTKYLTSDNFQKKFEAFKAVLKWVVKEFEGVRSNNLDSKTKLILGWGHAGNIFSILDKYHIKLDWITDTFIKNTLNIDYVFNEELENQELSHPDNLSYQLFMISGLGYSYKSEMSINLKGDLRDICTIKVSTNEDEKDQLHPVLLLDIRNAQNSINSFFDEKSNEIIFHVLDAELASQISTEAIESFIAEIIELLKKDPANFLAWSYLSHIYGNFKIPDKVKTQIEERIELLNLSTLQDNNIVNALYALLFVSGFAGQIDKGDLKKHLTEEVFKCIDFIFQTKTKSFEYGEKTFEKERLILLSMDVLLKLSKSHGSKDKETTEKFSEQVNLVLDKWPKASYQIRPLFEHLCNNLSISDSRHMLPTLMRIRAVA